MRIAYLTTQTLSPKAQEFVQFDIDSIRQAAAGRRGAIPETFIVDPAQYERNGRPLRDSPSPRLLGYAAADRTLYANDGCNSCTYVLGAEVTSLDAAGLAQAHGISERLLAALGARASGPA
jgi:hypothetical protein